MLKVILTGKLGQDAEMKEVGKLKAINFTVAVSTDHGKDSESGTEWVHAVMWKNEGQSTKVLEYLKKGKGVLIEGIPSIESYKTKEGQTKTHWHVTVKELEFLS